MKLPSTKRKLFAMCLRENGEKTMVTARCLIRGNNTSKLKNKVLVNLLETLKEIVTQNLKVLKRLRLENK